MADSSLEVHVGCRRMRSFDHRIRGPKGCAQVQKGIGFTNDDEFVCFFGALLHPSVCLKKLGVGSLGCQPGLIKFGRRVWTAVTCLAEPRVIASDKSA